MHMIWYVGWEEMWGSVLQCCHIASSSGVTVALGSCSPALCFCWCCSPGPPPVQRDGDAEPVPAQTAALALAELAPCPSLTAQALLCSHQRSQLSVPGVSWGSAWTPKWGLCATCLNVTWLCAMPELETWVWLLSGCSKKNKAGCLGVRGVQKCRCTTRGRYQCKSTSHFCLSILASVRPSPSSG